MLDISLDNLGLNGKLQFIDPSGASNTHGSGVGAIHEQFVNTLGAIHELFVDTLGSHGAGSAGHELHGVGDSFYNILPYMESMLGIGGDGGAGRAGLLPYIEELALFHH